MSDVSESSFLARWQPVALLSALLIALYLFSAMFGGGQALQIVTEMMIRLIVVVGLYIFIGNSGILSFGHISFMAIGAYAAVWFTCCTLPMVKPLYLSGLPEILKQGSYPFSAGLLSAALLSGLVALVVGSVLMRISGLAASIATFALLGVTVGVYGNWDGMTGGSASISNIPVVVGPALATGFAIAVIVVAFLHQNSRLGLMLRATRDDPVAARASGIRAYGVRLVAFVLSAVCVGLGGALYSGFLGILTVDTFYLGITFLTLAMLIVGGVGSLSGAVVGVLFITLITEILRIFERGISLGAQTTLSLPQGLQEVTLGICMILILTLRPKGIMQGKELHLPRIGSG